MLKRLTLDSKCMTEAVCDMLSIVNVSEQPQAMQCEIAKPGFAGRFQLKRLSSTIWPLLKDVCVVCKQDAWYDSIPIANQFRYWRRQSEM